MKRWVSGYGETLAPKLLIGAFYNEDIDWWGRLRSRNCRDLER